MELTTLAPRPENLKRSTLIEYHKNAHVFTVTF